MEPLIPPVAPAVVLSILTGAFYTCLYVVIRGRIGKQLPLTLVAAIAGAFVGHLFGRLAGDPIQLGDFNVLWATVGAWVGIVVVAGAMAIRPTTRSGSVGTSATTRSDASRPGSDAGTTPVTGSAETTRTGAPDGTRH